MVALRSRRLQSVLSASLDELRYEHLEALVTNHVGAVYCEDQFEAVAVPQRGDLVALAAITGLPAPDSSSAERDSLHGSDPTGIFWG